MLQNVEHIFAFVLDDRIQMEISAESRCDLIILHQNSEEHATATVQKPFQFSGTVLFPMLD